MLPGTGGQRRRPRAPEPGWSKRTLWCATIPCT